MEGGEDIGRVVRRKGKREGRGRGRKWGVGSVGMGEEERRRICPWLGVTIAFWSMRPGYLTSFSFS
jgi:hypothetical protein